MRPVNCMKSLVIWLMLPSAALAQQTPRQDAISCKPVTRISFERHTSITDFDGFLSRWHQKCFLFSASKGQHLHVSISDINDSSSFDVYKPGYKIEYGNYTDEQRFVRGYGTQIIPLNTYRGDKLLKAGADSDDGETEISTTLPVSGDYLIVVGISGSGASNFGGKISIK